MIITSMSELMNELAHNNTIDQFYYNTTDDVYTTLDKMASYLIDHDVDFKLVHTKRTIYCGQHFGGHMFDGSMQILRPGFVTDYFVVELSKVNGVILCNRIARTFDYPNNPIATDKIQIMYME